MFLIVPLSLIFISLAVIASLVWRKKPYLDKLYSLNTAGESSVGSINPVLDWKSYWVEFYPEIKNLINKVEFPKYKINFLVEVEKLLRKTRLISLKVERFSDSLIKRIRRVHINGKLTSESDNPTSIKEETDSINNVVSSSSTPSVVQPINPVFLKNEEERLIIEIAQNPKNAALYESLGDLYIEMSNFNDAKESFEAAIELNPQDESIKQKLSSVLEKLGSQD